MKTARRRLARGDVVAVTLVGVLFVTPLAGLTVAAGLLQDGDRDRVPRPEAVFAAVERAEFFDPVEVEVSMSWGADAAATAPAWGGLVTEVAVKAGDRIDAGTRILRIDGIWRVAAPTPAPFFAPVSARSSKGEIRDLNALLRALEYDVPGDAWTWNTVAGIRDLAAALGVPDAGALEAFDPAWVVWIPPTTQVVGSVPVVPGDAAPALGEDVIVGPPRLQSIAVTAREGNTLPVPQDGEEWMLRMGEAAVPYVAELSADAPGTAALALELGATQPAEANGVIERSVAVEGWQVPISSVHTDVTGTVCVFRGSESKLVPVVVTVDRGSIGTARVTGALSARDRILVNAAEIARSRSCD